MPAKSLVRKGNRRGAEAETRLATILEAARKLFLEHGYADTSLNDVIAEAGGSKATILKYFGTKAGLFSAVIAKVSERFVATAHLEALTGPPHQVLREFGEIVLRFYVTHDCLVAYRGVVAEGHRYSRMAKGFYQEGHVLVEAALAKQLAVWVQQGLIRSDNCNEDADLFLHLLRAGLHEQRLLGIRKSATPEEISARVAHVVQVFLHGVSNV